MWIIFALLTSLIYSIYYIFNQRCTLPPSLFMVYRGYYLGLLALPFVLIYAHTFPWQFYLIVILQGLTVSYSDLKYFQAFHKFGAENVTSITPLVVMITFLIWITFKPGAFTSYCQTPYRFLLIFASICLIVLAASKYRAQSFGKKCLKFMLPILFISALLNTSNKIIMYYADGFLLSATIHRVCFTGLIIGTVNLLVAKKHLTAKQILNPQNLKKALFILLAALSMISINFSMHYAANPAYTSALIYLSVVWIMLINKILSCFGYPVKYQSLSKKWVFVLLIATTILSIVAS